MTIPIIHCFDHNYVLPAAVCFRTMLEHAVTEDAVYDIRVIGSGLTDDDRALLSGIVAAFPQARIEFRDPPPNPVPPQAIPKKGHYSSDLYYKLMVPDLYPELDRAVLADVDAIWEDDVAKVFAAFPEGTGCLVAGAWDPGYAAAHGQGLFPTGRPLIRGYLRKFSAEEIDLLRLSAGLMVYDMAGLRREGFPRKWIDFAVANWRRAILPEQESINIVAAGRTAVLPQGFMADASHAEEYDAMSAGMRKANPAWDEMYAHPVMLHYASKDKPWRDPGVARADRWFAACARGGLLEEWRRYYANCSLRQAKPPSRGWLGVCAGLLGISGRRRG